MWAGCSPQARHSLIVPGTSCASCTAPDKPVSSGSEHVRSPTNLSYSRLAGTHPAAARNHTLQVCSPSCIDPLAASSRQVAGRHDHPSQPAALAEPPCPAERMQVTNAFCWHEHGSFMSHRAQRQSVASLISQNARLISARCRRSICSQHCPDLHTLSPWSSLLVACHLWACTQRLRHHRPSCSFSRVLAAARH